MIFDKRSLQVFMIGILTIVIIGLYGSYRCNNPEYKDMLMGKLKIWDLDGWSISHFTLFFILGYFYPDKMYFSLFPGLMWEAFEHYYGQNRPGFLGGFGDCMTTDPNVKNGAWWYGRLSDIIVNYLGFVIGSYMSVGKLTLY